VNCPPSSGEEEECPSPSHPISSSTRRKSTPQSSSSHSHEKKQEDADLPSKKSEPHSFMQPKSPRPLTEDDYSLPLSQSSDEDSDGAKAWKFPKNPIPLEKEGKYVPPSTSFTSSQNTFSVLSEEDDDEDLDEDSDVVFTPEPPSSTPRKRRNTKRSKKKKKHPKRSKRFIGDSSDSTSDPASSLINKNTPLQNPKGYQPPSSSKEGDDISPIPNDEGMRDASQLTSYDSSIYHEESVPQTVVLTLGDKRVVIAEDVLSDDITTSLNLGGEHSKKKVRKPTGKFQLVSQSPATSEIQIANEPLLSDIHRVPTSETSSGILVPLPSHDGGELEIPPAPDPPHSEDVVEPPSDSLVLPPAPYPLDLDPHPPDIIDESRELPPEPHSVDVDHSLLSALNQEDPTSGDQMEEEEERITPASGDQMEEEEEGERIFQQTQGPQTSTSHCNTSSENVPSNDLLS